MSANKEQEIGRSVKEWLETTSDLSLSTLHQAGGIDDGTALQICDACLVLLKSFSPYLSRTRQGMENVVAFQEITIKLQLWRDGFGPGELEKVLARSKTIQRAVARHLVSVAKLLTCGLFLSLRAASTESQIKTHVQETEKLVEEASNLTNSEHDISDEELDDDSPSSFHDRTIASTTSVVKDIECHISLLMNLLPSLHHFLEFIRQEREHKERAENRFTASQAASAYISIVREKFPRAKDEIVERLGEANWQRHLNIRRKLEKSAQGSIEYVEDIPIVRSMFRPISTVQSSGLGTSLSAPAVGSVTSHSSFRTSATDGDSGSLQVPATPPEVHLGLHFECHICGRMQTKIENRRQWKVHVFADLEAYICTAQECQYSLAKFPTRELWAAHEFSTHRKTKIWACTECYLEFPAEQEWVQHSEARHGLAHPGSDMQVALLAAEKIQDRQCPLCLKTINGKQKAFTTHVGKHMEAIALTALPKESESEGPKGGERRCCICHGAGYEKIVKCDNDNCEMEWFHFGCIESHRPSTGIWYCPNCEEQLNVGKDGQPSKEQVDSKDKDAPTVEIIEAIHKQQPNPSLTDSQSPLASENGFTTRLHSDPVSQSSVKMNRQELAMREKEIGKEDPITIASMTNLALALNSQGRYIEAESMHREALALREKVLGKEHPDSLASMNHLAGVLVRQGKYAEAETIYQETLALRRKVLGKEHPDSLVSMNNLAGALIYQRKHAESKEIYQETLVLRVKVLGKEHPDTLTSMNNLAGALIYEWKHAEAEAMNRETLALRKKVLGKEHPDTLMSMNNLASALSHQGKHAEAEAMHREMLALSEKVLGKENPTTLASMNNLASALNIQGKYVEAEAMHRETLALREKVLGKEHPDTLMSMNNLASALICQGKYFEAEAMHDYPGLCS